MACSFIWLSLCGHVVSHGTAYSWIDLCGLPREGPYASMLWTRVSGGFIKVEMSDLMRAKTLVVIAVWFLVSEIDSFIINNTIRQFTYHGDLSKISRIPYFGERRSESRVIVPLRIASLSVATPFKLKVNKGRHSPASHFHANANLSNFQNRKNDGPRAPRRLKIITGV